MIDTFSQHPWLLATVLLLLGLVVGSFLNVVIYRLPVMMESRWRSDCCELLEVEDSDKSTALFNLATPNSHCPHCKAAIRAWQNIPVLSYIMLAGKCGNCGAGISLRYPAIELLSGLMSLSLMAFFPPSMALLGALILTWSLIALTMIDFDHQLLPDDITLPLLWLGLILNINGTFVSLESAVLGAVLGYLSLWSIYWVFKLLTGKEGMGYGDFKLLAVLGAWLGAASLPLIIMLSSVVGAIIGIALILYRRMGRNVPMAFGPYLAIAGWVTLLWGEYLTALYLGSTGITP